MPGRGPSPRVYTVTPITETVLQFLERCLLMTIHLGPWTLGHLNAKGVFKFMGGDDILYELMSMGSRRPEEPNSTNQARDHHAHILYGLKIYYRSGRPDGRSHSRFKLLKDWKPKIFVKVPRENVQGLLWGFYILR